MTKFLAVQVAPSNHPHGNLYAGSWLITPRTGFSRVLFQDQDQDSGTLVWTASPKRPSLFASPPWCRIVADYAKDEDKFFKDFAGAFSKLLELGVDFPAPAAAA